MCVFYARVLVALRWRAFQICSPIFRGISWAIKMNSGILPLPLTLILKISLKEHIPVLTKNETEQQKKNLHEISHFRGRRRTSPRHYVLSCFPTPASCTPLRMAFLGQAVERNGWFLAQRWRTVWCGVAFTYRAGKTKRAWSCRSCQSRLSTHVHI